MKQDQDLSQDDLNRLHQGLRDAAAGQLIALENYNSLSHNPYSLFSPNKNSKPSTPGSTPQPGP